MKFIEKILNLIVLFGVIIGAGYLVYISRDNFPVANPFTPDQREKPVSEEVKKVVPPSMTDSVEVAMRADSLREPMTSESEPSDFADFPIDSGSAGLSSLMNRYFTRVAHYAIPRVVKVETSSNSGSSFFHLPFDDEEGEFWDGIGSGAIISPDGYIITNNHVVDNAEKIRIVFYDGRESDATLVGRDPLTDLALLKVNEDKPLPYFRLYKGKHLEIGEWVLAIGSPLNLGSSVTAGIISAMKRNIRIIESSYGIESFIQTDAVINPGNSGGPLVNLQGEIVGINTAMASGRGYWQSFGFAIPYDIIHRVVGDLRKFGRVRRGYLGVSITEVTFNIAKKNGLDKPMGVLVAEVQNDMPARKAGIRKGDIILEVNGELVQAPNDLQAKVSRYYPGDRVTIKIWREGKVQEIPVVLKEVQAELTRREIRERPEKMKIEELSLTIRNMKKDDALRFRSAYGVIVEKSEHPEINEGSVLLEINRHKIFNVENFHQLLNLFLKDHQEIELLMKVETTDGFLEKTVTIK